MGRMIYMNRGKILALLAAVSLLFSCAEEWKLIKESGKAPAEERGPNTYVFSRELLAVNAADSEEIKNRELENFKKEYYRKLIAEGKAKPGQEAIIDKFTESKTMLVRDYNRTNDKKPQQKAELLSSFTFDEAGFQRAVFDEKGIRIGTTNTSRIQKLLKSLNGAFNVLIKEEEIEFATDKDLLAAPKERGTQLLNYLVVTLGGGTLKTEGNKTVIEKEPDASVDQKVAQIADLTEKRKMITLKDYIAKNVKGDAVLSGPADARIKKSQDIAATIDFEDVSLQNIIEKIFLDHIQKDIQ